MFCKVGVVQSTGNKETCAFLLQLTFRFCRLANTFMRIAGQLFSFFFTLLPFSFRPELATFLIGLLFLAESWYHMTINGKEPFYAQRSQILLRFFVHKWSKWIHFSTLLPFPFRSEVWACHFYYWALFWPRASIAEAVLRMTLLLLLLLTNFYHSKMNWFVIYLS